MALRLAEAQQLMDVIQDPLFRPAFKLFLHEEHTAHIGMLLQEIRRPERNTMKEAMLAGKVDVFETIFSELEHFAARMMKEAAL